MKNFESKKVYFVIYGINFDKTIIQKEFQRVNLTISNVWKYQYTCNLIKSLIKEE